MVGGAVNVHITKDRGSPALNDAGERITKVAALARKYPDAAFSCQAEPVTLGIIGDTASVTESAVAKDILVAMGMAADRIELEQRSRTTCENAEQSADVAKPEEGQVWLLVTSASHMPRAVACFRAVGFGVVPFPVDYRTRDADLWRPPLSIADGLQMIDLAAHEWIGLIGYRVLGRTKRLLRSPWTNCPLGERQRAVSPPVQRRRQPRLLPARLTAHNPPLPIAPPWSSIIICLLPDSSSLCMCSLMSAGMSSSENVACTAKHQGTGLRSIRLQQANGITYRPHRM